MSKVLLLILLFFFAFDSISQVKVTNLPPASSVDPLDVVPMVDVSDGVTKKLPISVLDSRYTGNDAVNSVNGKTGVVVINKGDVGLGNADNTSDANKPISTATQAALNNKQNIVSGVDDTEIGYLNGVTSPIQSQIDGKVGKTGNDTILGTKSFTGRLETSSTTNSSRPCPPMTDAQMLALPSPGQGDCVYNATLDTMMVYKTSVPGWEEMGGAGGISNWITAHAYEVDDVVIESAKIYQCLIAHTSGTFATDLANGNWTIISGVNLSEATGILELDNGGTNKNLTPVNGGVAYTDADSFEVTAAGTSGQVLKSNGAAAPTWVNKSISGKAGSASSVTIEELQTNDNQLTETATNKYHLEAPGNLLVNGSFNAPVTSNTTPGWTVAATGGAVCTISISTSSPLDGEKQYLVLSGSTAVSGTPGTCSIKQEVTTTQQVNALVGLSFLANPTGAGCSANDLVVRTLVNGAVVTSRDVTNCGVTSEWDFFYVNEVTGGTSTGVEAIITLEASTANSIGIDVAKVEPRELSGAITGSTQSLSATLTSANAINTTLSSYGSGLFTTSNVSSKFRITATKNIVFRGDGFRSNSSSAPTSCYARWIDSGGNYLSYDQNFIGAGGSNNQVCGAGAAIRIAAGDYIEFDGGIYSGGAFSSAAVTMVAGEDSFSQFFISQCGAKCENRHVAFLDIATGNITGENVDFIAGNAGGTSSARSITWNSGIYTETPLCDFSVVNNSTTALGNINSTAVVNTSGVTNIFVLRSDTGVTITNGTVKISCDKAPADQIISNMIFGTFKDMMTMKNATKPFIAVVDISSAGAISNNDEGVFASASCSSGAWTVNFTGTAKIRGCGLSFISGANMFSMRGFTRASTTQVTFTTTNSSSTAVCQDIQLTCTGVLQ